MLIQYRSALVGLALHALFVGCHARPAPPAGDSAPPRAGAPLDFSEAIANTAGMSAPVTQLVDDPDVDGWQTEATAARVAERIDQLGVRVQQSATRVDDLTADDLLTSTFRCKDLLPTQLETVFDDGAVNVQRLPAAAPGVHVFGVAGLSDSLAGIHRAIPEINRFTFKVDRIEFGQPHTKTSIRVQVYGKSGAGEPAQMTAIWSCRWLESPSSIRLDSIEVASLELVTLRSPSPAWYRECTPSILGQNACYRDQLLLGSRHWIEQIETRLGADLMGNNGLAIGDINNDGLDDVYICQPGGLPNRLFVQNMDGTAAETSADAGVDFLDSTRSALLVDLDNDGHQDLVVATITRLLVLSGDGSGTFQLRFADAGAANAYSLAAADYDLDRRIDLFACIYHPTNAAVSNPLPYHDANNSSPNTLLRNAGDWKFENVTVESGLDEHNRRWSYAASWDDYDDDGDPDLYVANDFGRNCLYRNENGKFSDVAAAAGVEDVASGMSVSWGDYNRDGRSDLYIGNMYSAAGGRVTYQRRFKQDQPDMKPSLQRLARGNTLFENRGDGTFRDLTLDAGVEMGRWAWSSCFVDVNNDGWQDLVVANGHITGDDSSDL